jgi:hypothetical protein
MHGMSDTSLDRLDGLSAAFARLDGKAGWVIASAVSRGRVPLMYGFGRPNDSGRAPTAGLKEPYALAATAELHALTDQAGALVQDLRASSRCSWQSVLDSAGLDDLPDIPEPWGQWLLFLLSTAPLWGTPQTVPLGLGGDVAIYIHAYPQVCLATLAWLRNKLTGAGDGQQRDDTPSGKMVMTSRVYKLLEHLASKHPVRVSITDLAEALDCSFSTASRIVNQLQSQRPAPLVDRLDGERSGVAITDAGLAVIRRPE